MGERRTDASDAIAKTPLNEIPRLAVEYLPPEAIDPVQLKLLRQWLYRKSHVLTPSDRRQIPPKWTR